MKKFFVLTKKEIRELLTPYMLIPLLLTVFIFMGLGKVMDSQNKKQKAPQQIAFLDYDQSPSSNILKTIISKSNFKVDSLSGSIDQAKQKSKKDSEAALIVIPKGFEASLSTSTPKKITTYNYLSNFALVGSQNAQLLDAAIKAINIRPNPILTDDHVVVGDREANININQVMGFVTSQSVFIPVILFMIIIFASQMIATSIASEKENKTLETLLSSPVSRKAIVVSKLLAAGLVSLLFASVYILGMRYYMNGITGGGIGASLTDQGRAAIAQLGLIFNTTSYILLGLTLFFGILSGLAISLILGAFVEDVKSVQSAITPLMILVMVPYFLVLFLDFNTLSHPVQYLIYAIPFSHPFLAIQDLLLHQYTPVIWGIIYQALVFSFFVWLASRIFSSDQIMTMKIGKKAKV